MIRLAFFLGLFVNNLFAEYAWIVKKTQAKQAFSESRIEQAIKAIDEAVLVLEDTLGSEHVETLLANLMKIRYQFVLDQKMSHEILYSFFQRLGNEYKPIYIKLFSEFYNLCFDLHRRKKNKLCWWLIGKIQMLYLNYHSAKEYYALSDLRLGLIDLIFLKIKIINSDYEPEIELKESIDDLLLETYEMGSSRAALSLAQNALRENDLNKAALKAAQSLSILNRDWPRLYERIGQNYYLKSTLNQPLHSLYSLTMLLREIIDLLELISQPSLLSKGFPELNNMSLKEYLRVLEAITKERLQKLSEFNPSITVSDYGVPTGQNLERCKGSMTELAKGLRFNHMDNGYWIDIDAINNFEGTYDVIKLLSRSGYIDFFSRKLMHECYSKLQFKFPNLKTDYHEIILENLD